MRFLEQFIVSLDQGSWGAISRVALGLIIPPLVHTLSGGRDQVWIFLILFFLILVMLRVVPVILRRALPFSIQAKIIWAERRNLAKQHDSYQWQKLFWIGLGLLLNAAIGGKLANGQLVVTLFCLIGGGAGLSAWRRSNRAHLTKQLKNTPLDIL